MRRAMRRLPLTLLFASTVAILSGCNCHGNQTQQTDILVAVDPVTITLRVGQTQQFTATVGGTPNGDVQWSVDETGGGVISKDGLYEAPSTTGTFHVRATSLADMTKFASSTITVIKDSSGINVSISPSMVALSGGATQQFAAAVAGAESTDVEWTVQEGATGGTVDATGLYTAPATAGVFHVVAASVLDKSAKATATVTVTPVTISINPASVSLGEAETQQFTASVMGTSDTAVDWRVQETQGGAITPGGYYTAPTAPGVYHVIAASHAVPAKTATATITVMPATVSVTPQNALVEIGSTQQFTAIVTGVVNTQVNWTIQEGPSCGSIDTNGLYHPPSVVSTCHVVATSVVGGASNSATVNVIHPVTVMLIPSSVTLSMGQTQQFAATVMGSANQAVTWSVQEGVIGGAIDTTGMYTSPTVASQQVFHVMAVPQANPAKWVTATVTVNPGIGVQVAPHMVTLNPGATQTFIATVTGTANTAVTWAVQEGATGGSITAAGVYTAPTTSGTYHVVASAQADTNKKGFATVVVLGAPVDVTGIVTYSGAKTGRVYVILAPNDASYGIVGTSTTLVSGQAPFTLHGIQQRGNFRVRAFIDTMDSGMYHQAVDPFGSVSVTVADPGLSGVIVPASDSQWNQWISRATPSLTRVIPGDEMAVVSYQPAWDMNGNDECKDYRLYWSDQPGVNGTNNIGSMLVTANAPRLFVVRGLTNGQKLYFTMTCPDALLLGGLAPELGPITIGPGTGGFNLSGTVTSPTLPGTLVPPLYVIALSSSGGGVVRVGSPTAAQPWSMDGLSAGSYQVYAFRDVGADGKLTPTDPGNFFKPVTVQMSASQTSPTIDLSAANSIADVMTGHLNDSGAQSYTLYIRLRANLKRPVKAELTTGAKVAVPYSVPLDETGGARHRVLLPMGSIAPAAGDTYTLAVTYSDGTIENVNGMVTALLPTPTVMTPVAISGATPSFEWSALAPAPPTAYSLSLRVYDWPYLALGTSAQVLASADNIPSTTTLLLYTDVHPTQAQLPSNVLPYWMTLTAVDQDGNWSETISSFIVQ
jgi:hypothetical protein